MADTVLLGNIVHEIERCPHCGVAKPLLSIIGKASRHYKDLYENSWWHFTCVCSRCQRHTLFYGWTNSGETPIHGIDPWTIRIQNIYPPLEQAADELPDKARRFLQQAFESLHAPDGALMLAASSIDAMLKEKGLKDGSLYSRIELAHTNGLLTEQMRDWAHEIRLNANDPRHADDNFQGATSDDAKQVIEFAKALSDYLFVLPARVTRWKGSVAGA